jgi:microcystin-dependent protein
MPLTAQPAAPQWVFTLAQPAGGNVGALTAATTRKLSFFLDSGATCTWTMPGQHPETALIDELATDVICSRNGNNLFRGRVGGSTDTLAADADTVTFTAVDYRAQLGRRLLWPEVIRSFRGADQADIAWQMISDTQALTGGGLGITRGAAAATGVLRDRDYDPGKNLGEALTQLGDLQNGFDWEIDANRAFNLWHPQRGRSTGLVLYYGRDLTDVTRSTNPAQFGNAVYYTGAAATTPVETTVGTFDPQIGRWDAQKSDPNLVLQQTVADQAAAELAAASSFDAAFSVTMTAGVWDPTLLWLGDTAQLVIQAGRLNVNLSRRIIQIDVALSDDGGETVTLSVDQAVPVLTTRLDSYQSRLANLERTVGYIPDAPIGTMFDWPGANPPTLYHWADGTALSRAAYPDLYAVLGTTYGAGDGTTTFNLPDCRSRMTVAAGAGPGLTARTAGQVGGAETVQITPATTGVHTHSFNVQSAAQTGAHNHPFSASSGNESVQHTHTTGTNTVDHTHTFGGSQFNVAAGTAMGVVSLSAPVGTTSGASAGHTHGATTVESAAHAHAVSGTSGPEGANHSHGVTGTSDGGNTAGQAHENMPPWIAIGKVIKILSPQNQ